MAEKDLNDARVGAVFQHVRGKTVAQRMDGDALADASLARRLLAGCLQRLDIDVAAFAEPGEQPVFRFGGTLLSGGLPGPAPAAQHFQQARR